MKQRKNQELILAAVLRAWLNDIIKNSVIEKMKTIVPTALLAALICAGCASNYDMKLTNGMVITSKGKPRVDQKRHVIIFKDANGRTNVIPEFRVLEMGPHSTMSDDNSPTKFQSVTKK